MVSRQDEGQEEGTGQEDVNEASPDDNSHPSRFMETMGSRYSLLGLHPDCDGLTLDFTFGPERNGYSNMSVRVRKTETGNGNRNSKYQQQQGNVNQPTDPEAAKNKYRGSTVTQNAREAHANRRKWPFTQEELQEPNAYPQPRLYIHEDQRRCNAPSQPRTEGSVAAKKNHREDESKRSRSTIEEDWDPFSEFDDKLPIKLKTASRNVKATEKREKKSATVESLMKYAPASQANVESRANLSNQYGAGPGRILSRSMSQCDQLGSAAHLNSRPSVPKLGGNAEGNNLQTKSTGWLSMSQYPVQRKWQSSFANINMDFPQTAGKQIKGYSFCNEIQTDGEEQPRQSQFEQPSKSKNLKSKRRRLWRAAGGTAHERTQFHELMRKQTQEWVASNPQHPNFKSFEDANSAACQALRQRLQGQFPTCYEEGLVNSLLVLKYRNARRSNRALGMVQPPEDAESNQ